VASTDLLGRENVAGRGRLLRYDFFWGIDGPSEARQWPDWNIISDRVWRKGEKKVVMLSQESGE
jgi:hypothetical protein